MTQLLHSSVRLQCLFMSLSSFSLFLETMGRLQPWKINSPLSPAPPEITNSSVASGEHEQLTIHHSQGAKQLSYQQPGFLQKLFLCSSPGCTAALAPSAPADQPCAEFPGLPSHLSGEPLPSVKCTSSSVLLFAAIPAPSDLTQNIHTFTVPLRAEQQLLHPCIILYIYNKPLSLHTRVTTQEM